MCVLWVAAGAWQAKGATSWTTRYRARASVVYNKSRTAGPGAPSRPTPSRMATCTCVLMSQDCFLKHMGEHGATCMIEILGAHFECSSCTHLELCNPFVHLVRSSADGQCHHVLKALLYKTLGSFPSVILEAAVLHHFPSNQQRL